MRLVQSWESAVRSWFAAGGKDRRHTVRLVQSWESAVRNNRSRFKDAAERIVSHRGSSQGQRCGQLGDGGGMKRQLTS